jgi:hypothetical protein
MSRTQTQHVRNDLHLPGTEALAAHDDGGREGPRTAKDDTQPRGATTPASSHSPAAPLATGSSSSRRRRAPGRGERLRMEAPAPRVPLTGARAASRRSSRRGHGQRSEKEQFCWPLGCDEQHHGKREVWMRKKRCGREWMDRSVVVEEENNSSGRWTLLGGVVRRDASDVRHRALPKD